MYMLRQEICFNTFLFLFIHRNLVVVHFSALWAPQCKQMNDVLEELAKDAQNVHVKFLKVRKFIMYVVKCIDADTKNK